MPFNMDNHDRTPSPSPSSETNSDVPVNVLAIASALTASASADDKTLTASEAAKPVWFNSQELTVLRIQGEFYWHVHPDSDELFYVLDGDMEIHMRNEAPSGPEDQKPHTVVRMAKGDMFVVPKKTYHRSASQGANAIVMLKGGAMAQYL